MSDYKIKSDNVTFGKIGETVTEKDLEKLGVNIEALLEGGHLSASRATKKEEN
jgi:hypothetical protein